MVWFFIYVLLLHWVGDFLFQTSWIANNKSKDKEALFLHVFIYSLVLWLGIIGMGCWNINISCRYVVINFIIHISVDATTSKLTKWALAEEQMHRFFAVIGFDQFLHAATLLLTTQYLLGMPEWSY